MTAVTAPGDDDGERSSFRNFDAARDAERFTVSERGIVVIPKGYQFD